MTANALISGWLARIEETLPLESSEHYDLLWDLRNEMRTALTAEDAPAARVPSARLAPPADPAYGPTVAAHHAIVRAGQSRSPAHETVMLAMLRITEGDRRASAAHLVRAEVLLHDRPEQLKVRLALNHLPTAWVIACRAIEDAIAAGAAADLRDAAAAGDPAALREALRLELAETPPGRKAVADHLKTALEAVEREAQTP